MTPIDYLRALARRERKAATGGVIHPTGTPIQLGGCGGTGYLVPIPAVEHGPSAVITIDVALTRDQAKHVSRAAIAAMRTPSSRKNCGCWPRYTYCTCNS